MRRFNFKLEALLKTRRHAERQQQQATSAIGRERAALEASLRDQQQSISSAKRSLSGQLTGKLAVQTLRMHAASTIAAMRQAQRTVIELAGVQKRYEAAQAELAQAVKARRAIELLRERRMAEWLADCNRMEMVEFDDLATVASARKAMANATEIVESGQ